MTGEVPATRHVVVMGVSGAGKTTVAVGLAAATGLTFAEADVLRQGPPAVDFVHLAGPTEIIRARLSVREGHYMPPSLLDSQTATLEPLLPDEQGIILDLESSTETLVDAAVAQLGLPTSGRSAGPPPSPTPARR
ncbi:MULTISPECIES: gluconokinase [Micromonospora]|uniref:gluconokinase n=1 Tax=Micromonospora yangpuensis TaxID=683228 RepID=A0A1C6UP12_9ACTN|nr:hypothetical protein [Micromonospora yangpuensis]GGM08774.1 hypothetical protein GCM10012279_28570 [Micromonospora yangpuensis]SCL55766.1 carbohydrate kinase, thermoresistant glucokinase family [Micromonospora yangpuensis]